MKLAIWILAAGYIAISFYRESIWMGIAMLLFMFGLWWSVQAVNYKTIVWVDELPEKRTKQWKLIYGFPVLVFILSSFIMFAYSFNGIAALCVSTAEIGFIISWNLRNWMEES